VTDERPRAAPGAEKPGPRPLILLAEDNPALAEMLTWLLDREGFETLHAADGMSALAMARQGKPALILSDVTLPRMDGFTLCRMIKSDARLTRIPFVFLTARTQESDRETALKAGADEYVTKPIPNADLVKMIRKHLG
jgi:CheY-like chemotaxis protein